MGAFSVCCEEKAKPPEIIFSQQIALATQGLARGLSITDGKGSYSASMRLSHKSYFVGLRAFNIITQEGGTLEHQSQLGKRGKIGDYNYSTAVLYRVREGNFSGFDNEIFEIDTTLERRQGKNTARLRYAYSPDGFGQQQQAHWLEVGLRRKLNDKLDGSLMLASRSFSNQKDYLAFNAGLFYRWHKSEFDLRVHDTNKHKRGERFQRRTILSLIQDF